MKGWRVEVSAGGASPRPSHSRGPPPPTSRTRRWRPYRPWLQYATEPLVSSDVIGNPSSAVFDSLATLSLSGGLVKTVTWYDNGWGYSSRIVETLGTLARLGDPEVAS